ncbi:hypothetical protein GCM10007387_57640 [Pseudoduganella albidiflava]|nr:hypothetical protein GCM10007387_57640 [Pseudoduganella albidiflava]
MAADLPPLPSGHPRLNGKINRFGKGKKAWYQLREFTLRSGRQVITGAYGVWQGQNPNSVSVKFDWEGVSEEERAEAARRQADDERKEHERRENAARFAANRAGQEWKRATAIDDAAAVPYLVKKHIDGEFARVSEDGTLLVPARRYRAGQRPELVCLQKIDAVGGKRFNAGADMVGAACLLGTIARDETRLIGVGEGYATGQSVRLAEAGTLPFMVAFNAGNLLAVARQLRADFPHATLLFFADDDWQLVQRYQRDLTDDFDIDTAPLIDGADHVVTNGKGESVTVRATWRKDATGTDYIECDIRCGRRFRQLKFENAGISKARAAAAAVGNAHVCWPKFAARGENKWTDFNDLHVEESIEAARTQVMAAIAVASAVPAAAMVEQHETVPTERAPDAPAESPAPPGPTEPAELVDLRVPTIEALLSHFALIYPTTDVWDGLRKQRMKKSSFAAWVGKDLATQWEKAEGRRTIMRESLPTLIGGKAMGASGEGGKLGEMLEQLTLLRGTETVWDGIGQQVMSLGAVRADYTADLTARWQEHSLRKTIEARNLVFDPTQTADPVTHVNIFLGWPLVPKANEDLVLPILALLESLCSAEDRVDECVAWILRWLAYPLQHPGAKMQTALLMFGEKQGTGKSLFFQDVMAPIYGEYGTVASQHQLDSTFTAWRSRKLFVLFEEVLSRDDKYSHNGTLKYMVTGKQMSINQKNLPERTERNHMNAVFLSNEPQPIPIELEDRRFMVVEARKKQDAEFYARVKASIDAGGLEAFYHFLLNFPLDDFDEHTKPPMTLAKERVIEFGLSGWMSFHRAWKDGYLDAPYCSCLTEDLYNIYKRWCDKSGEKPLTLCKFSGLIASREHKVKRKVAVGNKQPMYRMVFEIVGPEETESMEKQIARFRKLADVRADGALG